MRTALDPDATLEDFISPGSEWIEIGRQRKHVKSYLGDFLFSPARSNSPVRSLSGGERNRLLLARLFARPANVLVLDEPTNDLDIETLELLESLLADWPGTLLLVSHDRAFIDNVVTSTLAFEGNGRIVEYVGGYEDWLRQRGTPEANLQSRLEPPGGPKGSPLRKTAPSGPRKASYKEQQELLTLPGRIEALEAEQQQLQDAIASPDFYKEGAGAIAGSLARLETIEQELLVALARWDELDSLTKR
jgi:ATP-binding cassette subfamily F protein uup